MKVFISWSGERSEALAKALREWFPLVLHYVEPWLSQSDIQAGERWSIEIAKELGSCNFGVICITRENIGSPWILFEAGALAKSMQEGRVIPLLLDLDFKEISGPLAQFQAKKVDNVGIKELVQSLNKAASAPIGELQLDKLFLALWADLEKQISSIPKSGGPTKHSRPQGEILEELVASVRSVEMRVRDVVDDDLSSRKRRKFRSYHFMINELIHRFSDGPRDPVQILILASLIRDELPWVYELALETYRAMQSGNGNEGYKARRRFMHVLEMLQHGPIFEELGIDRSIVKLVQSEIFRTIEMINFNSNDDVNKSTRKRKTLISEDKDIM